MLFVMKNEFHCQKIMKSTSFFAHSKSSHKGKILEQKQRAQYKMRLLTVKIIFGSFFSSLFRVTFCHCLRLFNVCRCHRCWCRFFPWNCLSVCVCTRIYQCVISSSNSSASRMSRTNELVFRRFFFHVFSRYIRNRITYLDEKRIAVIALHIDAGCHCWRRRMNNESNATHECFPRTHRL